MSPLIKLIRGASTRARAKRAAMFRRHFDLGSSTRLLDLGSEDGSHVAQIIRGTSVRPENVYIADIDSDAVARGHRRFGYQPVVIEESGRLPYPDRYFDIVLCSSVIEHVTVPKRDVWQVRSGRQFRRIAAERQRALALEVARVGAQYYVQTPNRSFLIESHSWLPLLGFLPRRLLVPALRLSNAAWIKRTAPDWNLLDERGLRELFPDAEILRERFLGMTKSVIAVRRARPHDTPRPMVTADYRDADAELAATLATCIREGARVLEAGGGSLSHVSLPPRAHITVIDISPEQLAHNHYADVKVQGDLHVHEFAPDSFDVILCWDVIEHLENPKRVFESFVRWVRPGGVIVIAAPNPHSLSGQITKHTPHWFHVWMLKHVFCSPYAGEHGQGPFPTFMDPAMYPEALAGLVHESGLRLVHMRCYASSRLEHLQQHRPLLGRVFTTALRALRAAAHGRWQPEQSDFHLIAQKPQ